MRDRPGSYESACSHERILARYRCCNLHVSKYHHALTGPDGKDGVSSLNITTTTSVGAEGEGGGSVECVCDLKKKKKKKNCMCIHTR